MSGVARWLGWGLFALALGALLVQDARLRQLEGQLQGHVGRRAQDLHVLRQSVRVSERLVELNVECREQLVDVASWLAGPSSETKPMWVNAPRGARAMGGP